MSTRPTATGRFRSRFAELTHSLSAVGQGGLFKRHRETESPRAAHETAVVHDAATVGKSPREALAEQWLRIRAGFGASAATIDSMDAVYRKELQELKSAEAQACALADEIWVTLLNEPLAERVSQYVAALRRRAAEHGALAQEFGEVSRMHSNPVMRAFVYEASRTAELCATRVRDVVLVATLQHMIHYLIASYGTIAAHAKALGIAAQAARFAEFAESDQQFDADLSALAMSEVNPLAPQTRESPH